MNAIRLSMIAAVALCLTACGGAKLGGGKQGAAEALFKGSAPASKANGQALKMQQAGLTTVDVKVDGAKSGTATLSFVGDSTNTTGGFTYNIKYDNYSDDGKNYISGNMQLTMDFNLGASGTSGAITLKMKGRIDFSGEISDFVDADVTETVDFAKLSEQSGSVTVTLNGSIKTSSDSYVYNNEQVSFTADSDLPKDDGSKA